MTLIVLAGGLGSRFGGPKQFFPLGPNGECLYHYSLFHAIDRGVTELILLTRAEVLGQAQKSVQGIPIPVEIVLQETPGGKPPGTAHAVASCLSVLNSDQAIVINADDYYGDATFAAANALASRSPDAATVPYLLLNTLSDFGGVSRAICQIENGELKSIQETHDIVRDGDQATGTARGQQVELSLDDPVSMNCFLLAKSTIETMAHYVHQKLANQETGEITLPDFLQDQMRSSGLKIFAQLSDAEWFGLTFKEDIDSVTSRLSHLHESGKVPSRLW